MYAQGEAKTHTNTHMHARTHATGKRITKRTSTDAELVTKQEVTKSLWTWTILSVKHCASEGDNDSRKFKSVDIVLAVEIEQTYISMTLHHK